MSDRRLRALACLASLAGAGAGCTNESVRSSVIDSFEQQLSSSKHAASPGGELSVRQLIVDLRTDIDQSVTDSKDREALFEVIPQGLRMFSGVPSRDEEYLRNGILTVTTFVKDSLDADHDLAELRRVANALAPIEDKPLPGEAVIVQCTPEHLHRNIRERIDGGSIEPITLVGLSLPFKDEAGTDRVRCYHFFWCKSDGWLGHDCIETSPAGHERGYEVVGAIGTGLSTFFGAISATVNRLFEPDHGSPLSVANIFVSGATHAALATKETAFEVVKMPLAGFASLLASDYGWRRFGNSTLEPMWTIDDIWRHHMGLVWESGWRQTPVKSLDTLLQIIPLVGNYMPHYFDDPWTQFAESPPLRNFTDDRGSRPTDKAGVARTPSVEPESRIDVFVTRGVHGGDESEQGNELWIAAVRDRLSKDRLKDFGFGNEPVEFVIHEAPYKWGTFLDAAFSFLNLSSGYAYTLECDVRDALAKDPPIGRAPPVVSFIAHSGGVQRATIASRLLWSRDVFTDTIYGVAGPATAYAPVKPKQNHIVLSKSEYQDSDVTSRISTLIADVEHLVLWVFEIPVVGLMWEFSYWSRGYPTTYANDDVFRIEGRASTVHRNPGKTVGDRGDVSLTFFRDDLTAILAEKALLRAASTDARTAVATRTTR